MNKLYFLILCMIFSYSCTKKSNLENTDYIQIILYGQSLSMGCEAPEAITTQPLPLNYMVGDGVLPKYNSGESILYPLIATKWLHGGEQPIVVCLNSFSTKYRKNVRSEQKFIGMTGGEGGRTIESLSKESTNSDYYASTFTAILNKTSIALSARKETVSCPAIIYMQGESNCNNPDWHTNQGLTPGSNGTTNKNEYKALLLQLKNNMQTDIILKYNQKQKPLFFIYQTSGMYIQQKEMPIATAQFEFAMENDDVIMLNPHYALPDYNGGHLSTNGYRWYGEIMGDILYRVLVEGKDYKPVYPERITKSGNTVEIDFYVPVPPLVFDTLTTNSALNYGFCIYDGNYEIPIGKIDIKEKTIIITCTKNIPDNAELIYAGNNSKGSGNLCDSYNEQSLYTYYDDSSTDKHENYTPKNVNGKPIYNQPYPMQNWCVSFYHNFAKKE